MKSIIATLGAVLTFSGASADQYGLATYYHNPSHGGLIAAHLTLPFGTRVRVTNLDNGRSVVVVIVDRGPYAYGRIIDVSTVAAGALGMLRAGVAPVRLEWTPEAPVPFTPTLAAAIPEMPPAPIGVGQAARE